MLPQLTRGLRYASPQLLRIAGLFLLVYLILRIDLKELAHTWIQADKGLLVLAVLPVVPTMLIKIQRWRYLLSAWGRDYPFGAAANAYLATYYIGLLTPGRAGEMLRAIYVNRYDGAGVGTALVSVVVDRVFDVMVIIAVVMLGIWFVPQFEYLDRAWVWASFVTVGLLTLAVMVRFKSIEKLWLWFRARLPRAFVGARDGNSASDIFAGLRRILTLPYLGTLAILSVASWALVLLTCYLIASALSLNVSFSYLSVAVSVAALISLLPISIGGLGVRDSVLILVLGLIDVTPQQSLAFSLLYFAIFGILLGIVGAILWYRRPVQI